MVGEYLGGGDSGFSSDEDGATARINFQVGDQDARNLWDVQAAIQQIATDFQTAVRSAADFSSYLISIRETAQTIKMPNLGLEAGPEGNMSYSGGRVDPGSVATSSGEAGMAQRYAEMVDNQGAGGAGGGAIGSRSGRSGQVDVGGFINNVANSGFMAEMAFRRQGHGGTDYGGDASADMGVPSLRGDRLVMHNVNQQMSQGGRVSGGIGIGQAVGAGRAFMGGGGMGAFASMFGKIGAAGAGVFTAYQVGNAALETYAQSRAMAISTNNSQNGWGWGFDQRVHQATMAMSPFVSQEDAAQIYQAATDQGWASNARGLPQGTFDQAVNFMYDAAKNYQMSPQVSAQLLQTNTLGGAGESVQALSEQLLTLKKTLDGTGVSMAAANATFASFNSFLFSQGATPEQSTRLAGGAIAAFAKDTYLGPTGAGAALLQGALSTNQTQNMLAGITGVVPGTAFMPGHAQRSADEMQKLIHSLATQYNSMTGMDPENRAGLFTEAYNLEFGTNIDPVSGEHIMKTALDPNFWTKGQNSIDNNSGMHLNSAANGNDRNAWDRYTGAMKDKIHDNWLNVFSSWFTSAPALVSDTGTSEHSSRNYSPEVQDFLDHSADASKVSVLDEKGNKVATGSGDVSRWFSNGDNFKKFTANGSQYTIYDGSSGKSVNAFNLGNGGWDSANAAGQNGSNTVYFSMADDLKKYVSMDKTSITTGPGMAYSGK